MVRIGPPPDDGFRDRLIQVLSLHAEAEGHPFRMEHVALEAQDGDTYLGGLTARMGEHWVFVELLAVVAEARGRGIGRQLMAAIEDLARQSGRIGIWLDTFSFQAPAFYESLGYRQFGRIEDYPPGQSRLFYFKRLDTAEKDSP